MASKVITFRYPKTVILRFVSRQSIKSAALYAIIIAVYVASKGIGFGKLYPTYAARAKLAATFSNNAGLSALLGKPGNLTTVGGYIEWNTVGVVVIVFSIWALLLATKTLRGAEDSGRWELLLAGQTTAKKALLNSLAGLYSSLVVLYAILSVGYIFIGRNHYVNYSASQALLFALTSISAAVLFIAIGAFSSQLMPTRSKAAGLAAGIFGLFYLVRAAGDITNIHWLLYITPLGWIEKLQPLSGNKAIWFLPIILTTLLLIYVSAVLAGKRDIGDSFVKDKLSAKPKTRLLNNLIPSGIRFTYVNALSWLGAVGFIALFYGVITKSATQILTQSTSTSKVFNKVVHTSQGSLTDLFLGIAFLLYIILIMCFVASSVNRMREEEATSLLDNFFVGPIKRYKWLLSRALITLVVVLALAFFSGLATYIGIISQSASVSVKAIFDASINTIAPALFILGLAVFAMGYLPRLTSVISYGIIGWSFLIYMLSSGLNLNHWIIDSSILTHISLAPAVAINWKANYIILALSALLLAAGVYRFNTRDLALE